MLYLAAMIKRVRAVAVLFVFALAAAAQTPVQNWNNVKALSVGTSVRLSVGSRTVRGQVQGVTDDSLAVDSGTGQEMFTRQEVRQVSAMKNGHSRGRNMLIGLGIGAGAGAALGAPLCGGSGYSCSKGLSAGIGAGLFGVFGALASAFFHTGGWREVYQR